LSQLGGVEQPKALINPSVDRVTPFSQLADVQSGDWAYRALQSLLNRYGAQVGYLAETLQKHQTVTRYEFAEILSHILVAHRQTAAERDGAMTLEEQQTLQRLQAEFRMELSALQSQVEALETLMTDLEDGQVSPATVLSGEVILGLGDDVGDDVDESAVLQESVTLTFDTSFTGEDELEIELESGNAIAFSSIEDITLEGRLGFPESTENGELVLSGLSYEFPVSDRTILLIAAKGDNTSDMNPLLGDSARGAISEFGQENPIHSLVQDSGMGISFDFTDALSLSLGYFGGEAFSSGGSEGLFNGAYSALAQLEFDSGDSEAPPQENRLLMGLTYIHAYSATDFATDTGSLRSQIDLGRPVVGNAYGFSTFYLPDPRVAIGGWAGFTHARVIGLGDARVWNYALTLAFPDLGRSGNLLGFVVGREPWLTGTDGFPIEGRSSDPNPSWHIEAFYRHQIADNLSISPGFIWITAPNPEREHSDFLVLTVRTAFEF
jgi:hypothetical protein